MMTTPQPTAEDLERAKNLAYDINNDAPMFDGRVRDWEKKDWFDAITKYIADEFAAQRESLLRPFIDSGLALSDGTPRKALGTLPVLKTGEIVGNHATVWANNADEVFSLRMDNIGATDGEESDAFFEAGELYSSREAALAAQKDVKK